MSTIAIGANGAYAIGPLFVASACLLSIASSSVWGRNIGEVSCKWRLDYSPDGRTFGIWALIYLWTFASVIIQLAGEVVVLGWWVNLCWGCAWICCALWVPTFDADRTSALKAAAVVIAASAAFSTAGAWHAQAWVANQPGQRGKQLSAEIPLTLLAGWLSTATALNIGIAYKASRPDATSSCVYVSPRRYDEDEEAFRYRMRVMFREAYAKAPGRTSVVPLALSVAVATVSALARDLVFVLPLAWAILNMQTFPNVTYLVALAVLAAGAALGGLGGLGGLGVFDILQP